MLGRDRGFTLVELLIALALMGILLAMAMPSYRTWIQNTRIRTTAESLLNGLQLARNEALRRNANVEFVLNGANSGWDVKCVAISPGCPDTDTIHKRTAGEGSSSSITITASNGGTIRFNSFGRMYSPVPGVGTRISFDIDNSLLSTTDSRDLRVTVDTGGNVRMCDPNVAVSDPRHC